MRYASVVGRVVRCCCASRWSGAVAGNAASRWSGAVAGNAASRWSGAGCVRRFSTKQPIEALIRHYNHVVDNKLQPDQIQEVGPANGVFTHTELRLCGIDVIGFDYDYTLATYNRQLEYMIFDKIVQELVSQRHYPKTLKELRYDPDFLARGLHYNPNNGVFLKVDTYHRIQADTARRLFTKISEEEVDRLYPGKRIFFGRPGIELKQEFKQIVDIFQLPTVYAWAAVLEYLERCDLKVHPYILHEDITKITHDLHVGGILHNEISRKIGDYLLPNPELAEMLTELKGQGKELFILTNSPYHFLNTGMNHVIGDHWKELFDVIICQSRKPEFFEQKKRLFRKLSYVHGSPMFGEVKQLKAGRVYVEGNVADFHRLTGWDPHSILYFGDQMYADLAVPVLTQGWHTGAIIRELADEMEHMNTHLYQQHIYTLTELNYLIRHIQDYLPDPTAVHYVDMWCAHRKQINQTLRDMWPGAFGSIFRTHLTPTEFYRRLSRFAEIYTSTLTNLAQYNAAHHRFTPVRTQLAHERKCETLK